MLIKRKVWIILSRSNYIIYIFIFLCFSYKCKRELPLNSFQSERPSWAPDSKKIAFNSHRDGHNEIYIMNVNGSNVIQLTDNKIGDYTPFWSPDGKQIAIVSNRNYNSEIYCMNLDGSSQTILTYNKEGNVHPLFVERCL